MRQSDLWRLDLAPPIGCNGRKKTLPIARHLAFGWSGVLHQLPAQVLFHDGHVFRAFQNGPTRCGFGGSLLFGHTIHGGQKQVAARIQFL